MPFNTQTRYAINEEYADKKIRSGHLTYGQISVSKVENKENKSKFFSSHIGLDSAAVHSCLIAREFLRE